MLAGIEERLLAADEAVAIEARSWRASFCGRICSDRGQMAGHCAAARFNTRIGGSYKRAARGRGDWFKKSPVGVTGLSTRDRVHNGGGGGAPAERTQNPQNTTAPAAQQGRGE